MRLLRRTKPVGLWHISTGFVTTVCGVEFKPGHLDWMEASFKREVSGYPQSTCSRCFRD